MAVEVEPAVVLVEPEEEPFEPVPATEHRLLDMAYDGEPGTAGLAYPAPGEVEEEFEPVAPV